MSRSAQPLVQAAGAAFDFDVVTDAPPPRQLAAAVRTEPVPDTATPLPALPRREEAES